MKIQKSLFFGMVLLFFGSCDVEKAAYDVSQEDELQFEKAKENGRLANEGFIRCENFVHGWLQHCDSASGLIPRNIESSRDFWNAKDAAADNYPFMVLTSYFVDKKLFEGKMRDILTSERRLTSRVRSLPDTYSFSKKGFLEEAPKLDEIVFGSSEYIKDGLLPLTEWLGSSRWSDRMLEMLHDLNTEIEIAGEISVKGYGSAPKEEVNGELLQVLSRIYWMTNDEKFLDWAIKIGDYYLLGDHHPTKDLTYIRLRDHGCELISGLCELYATTNFARPEKKQMYKQPIHEMLDRILAVGRNEDGLFYNGVNPKTGEIVNDGIADTWGYTLNGYYTVYLIDRDTAYRNAVLKVFSNLNNYKNYDWENGSADGYADAIESALNLYNRIPDPKVAEWIDSEMQVMWKMQKADGVIEGWHGDGNFARTTIMYNLWKSKGLSVSPWRNDIKLGAEQKGDSLLITLSSDQPWAGKLFFDKQRFKENMKLPVDWPRINQFPEWFTTDNKHTYTVIDPDNEEISDKIARELIDGIDITLSKEKRLIVIATAQEGK